MFWYAIQPYVTWWAKGPLASLLGNSSSQIAWLFILHLLGDTSAPVLFGAAVDALQNTQKAFFIFSWSLLLAGACCLLAARFASRQEPSRTSPS